MSKRLQTLLPLLLFFCALSAFFVSPRLVRAQSWSSTAPTISLEQRATTVVAPPSVGGMNNVDCVALTYQLKSTNGVTNVPDCYVAASTGAVLPNGYMQVRGTSLLSTLTQPGTTQPIPIVAIPHSPDILLQSPLGSGFSLRLVPNLYKNLQFQTIQGRSYANVPPGYGLAIADQSGTLARFRTDSYAFSANGNWMIIDAPGVAVMRINLTTGQLLPFAPTYSTASAHPYYQFALSNNGRYAVVSSLTYNTFRLYDLATCASTPASITSFISCQVIDIKDTIMTAFPSFRSAHHVRFISETAISFYGSRLDENSTRRTDKFYASVGALSARMQYLALGDSFSSGEGAFEYLPGTDTQDNRCHVSRLSYPFLLSFAGSESFRSVTCSGAVTEDLISRDLDYEGQAKPELAVRDRDVESILNTFSPGYIGQVEFVERYQPEVITLSIGGNDMGFSDIIKACLVPDTCYDSYSERVGLLQMIYGTYDSLVETYNHLKRAGPDGMRIYVMGYPQLFAPMGNCAANVHLNQVELRMAELMTEHINDVIAKATRAAGVFYVDVSHSLDGSRLCETTTSSVAAHGLTAGTDIPNVVGLIGNESFHPNAKGHSLLTQTLLSQTSQLSAAMPAPLQENRPTYPATSELLNLPESPHAIQATHFHEFSNAVSYKSDGDLQVTLDTSIFSMERDSRLKITAYSDAVVLGEYTANSDYTLDVRVPINSLSPGFHTFHITGKNILGETVDIVDVVYIAAHPNDTDGDGIPNNQDKCHIVTPSAQDRDVDGIDDACDSDIGLAPTPAPQLYRARQDSTDSSQTVYIERNVRLAAELLQLQDSDTDGDGWALVAKSQNANTSGEIAHFWIEEVPNAFPPVQQFIPHVSIRTARRGCVQLRPAQLASVGTASRTSLRIEAIHAPTCGGNIPKQDRNANGTADDEEPLYRVRLGNTAKNEPASLVLIERNRAAAEALLGISDYDGDGDGWSVVGSSINTGALAITPTLWLFLPSSSTIISTDGIFPATLAMLSIEEKRTVIPYIGGTSRLHGCVELQPYNLSVVKAGQNRILRRAPPVGMCQQ